MFLQQLCCLYSNLVFWQHPTYDTRDWKAYKTKVANNIMELVKAHAIFFNIFLGMRYHHVKVVNDRATLQASTIGLGKFIKIFDMFSIKEKCKVLAQAMW
jgi:hypothetical protein